MAEKKKEEKIVLERVYNVPLRKEFQKAPKWKRTPRAVSALRAFVVKHMKSDNVHVGKYLNLELWKHGIKNPPHHVKVDCKKDSEGKVAVEIVGAPVEKPKKKEEKKEAKKPEVKAEESKLEKKTEAAKEDKLDESKKIEKEELKEIKKEKPKVHAPKQTPIPKSAPAVKQKIPGR
jgi:large subunit ribosomal protein L31e|tara:strand:- start:217 stop:744 length:528 start_codon:yes stop_codon:yes gene_type:complete